MATRRGLVFAKESGLRNALVESDSLNAVHAIIRNDTFAEESQVIQDIRSLFVVSDGPCYYISINRNKAVLTFVKFALPISSN